MPFSIWVANELWNKLNLLKFRICILIVHTRRKIGSTTYRQFQLVNFNMNYSSGYVGSTFLKKKRYLCRITFAEFCNAIVYHSIHGKNKLSPIRANVQFHLFFFFLLFTLIVAWLETLLLLFPRCGAIRACGFIFHLPIPRLLPQLGSFQAGH